MSAAPVCGPGESAHRPEAVLSDEHGGGLGPALGPAPSWNLAAPAARALCSPGSAQTGRRHRIPEHLQPGQALSRVQGRGYGLEGPGEPGRAGRKGRVLSLLGDAGKRAARGLGLLRAGGLVALATRAGPGRGGGGGRERACLLCIFRGHSFPASVSWSSGPHSMGNVNQGPSEWTIKAEVRKL